VLAVKLRSFSDERTGSRQICLVSITLALPFFAAVATPAAVPCPASSALLDAQGFLPPAVVSAVRCLFEVF